MPRRPVGAHLVAAVDLDLGAELGERVDVRVEAPAADDVAAGRRDLGAAEAREQRPGEQERRADAAAELLVELASSRSSPAWTRTSFRPSTRRRRRGRRAARPSSRRRGCAGRSRASPARSVSSARGEDRQRAVLVPGGADPAAQRLSALDDEGLHKRSATSDVVTADGGAIATQPCGSHTRTGLGDADAVHEERGAAAPRARRRGRRRARTPRSSARTRSSGARRAAPRLRLRDPPDARQAPAGRRADPARGGLAGGGDRGGPLARGAPRAAARHAAEEDALRLRRALRLRPRVRARPARRDRDARAEVGAEEAEAAVVRGRRPPRRGLRRAPRRSGSTSTSTSRS